MDQFKEIAQFFQRPFVRRLMLLLLVGLVLFLLRGLLTLLLLTFIFVYLINTAQGWIERRLSRFVRISNSLLTVIIYLVGVAVVALVVYVNAPRIGEQVADIVDSVTNYIIGFSQGGLKSQNPLLNGLLGYVKTMDVATYVESLRKYVTNMIASVGTLGFYFLMSLLLSLFFMLQKRKVLDFFRKFKTSRIGWLYEDARYFLIKFTDTFGKVIQTQILIAFINSLLSVVILAILGFQNLLGLWVMILVLGMVPMAGVFISLVPLSVIAFNIGGLRYVVYILILIFLLHTLEGYVLNPKLMSSRVKLPVFITFLILICSEYLFGVWGLIVGIPVAVFLLDLIDVKLNT